MVIICHNNPKYWDRDWHEQTVEPEKMENVGSSIALYKSGTRV